MNFTFLWLPVFGANSSATTRSDRGDAQHRWQPVLRGSTFLCVKCRRPGNSRTREPPVSPSERERQGLRDASLQQAETGRARCCGGGPPPRTLPTHTHTPDTHDTHTHDMHDTPDTRDTHDTPDTRDTHSRHARHGPEAALCPHGHWGREKRLQPHSATAHPTGAASPAPQEVCPAAGRRKPGSEKTGGKAEAPRGAVPARGTARGRPRAREGLQAGAGAPRERPPNRTRSRRAPRGARSAGKGRRCRVTAGQPGPSAGPRAGGRGRTQAVTAMAPTGRC